MTEDANVQTEFDLKLTQWEADTLLKAMNACSFPGTHLDISYNLMLKLKAINKAIAESLNSASK